MPSITNAQLAEYQALSAKLDAVTAELAALKAAPTKPTDTSNRVAEAQMLRGAYTGRIVRYDPSAPGAKARAMSYAAQYPGTKVKAMYVSGN